MSSRWVVEKFRAEGYGKECDLLQVVIVYPEKTPLRSVERESRGLTTRRDLLVQTKQGYKFRTETGRKKPC